jgi:N6-adenosine-specific RNA methylase IME4
MMTKEYGVILADPPWDFKTRSHKGEGRSAKAYFDTMTVEEIAALPVADLAAKDRALFCGQTRRFSTACRRFCSHGASPISQLVSCG